MKFWPWLILGFGIGCGCPKPKCPTCPPPQVVEVRKPCMDPLPDLPKVQLPAPDDSGVMHLDEDTYRALYELLAKLHGYLATQLERCVEVPASQP